MYRSFRAMWGWLDEKLLWLFRRPLALAALAASNSWPWGFRFSPAYCCSPSEIIEMHFVSFGVAALAYLNCHFPREQAHFHGKLYLMAS